MRRTDRGKRNCGRERKRDETARYARPSRDGSLGVGGRRRGVKKIHREVGKSFLRIRNNAVAKVSFCLRGARDELGDGATDGGAVADLGAAEGLALAVTVEYTAVLLDVEGVAALGASVAVLALEDLARPEVVLVGLLGRLGRALVGVLVAAAVLDDVAGLGGGVDVLGLVSPGVGTVVHVGVAALSVSGADLGGGLADTLALSLAATKDLLETLGDLATLGAVVSLLGTTGGDAVAGTAHDGLVGLALAGEAAESTSGTMLASGAIGGRSGVLAAAESLAERLADAAALSAVVGGLGATSGDRVAGARDDGSVILALEAAAAESVSAGALRTEETAALATSEATTELLGDGTASAGVVGTLGAARGERVAGAREDRCVVLALERVAALAVGRGALLAGAEELASEHATAELLGEALGDVTASARVVGA